MQKKLIIKSIRLLNVNESFVVGKNGIHTILLMGRNPPSFSVHDKEGNVIHEVYNSPFIIEYNK